MVWGHEMGHCRKAPPDTRRRRPVKLTQPVVAAFHELRAQNLQLRAGDAITSFAGSMMFVYTR